MRISLPFSKQILSHHYQPPQFCKYHVFSKIFPCFISYVSVLLVCLHMWHSLAVPSLLQALQSCPFPGCLFSPYLSKWRHLKQSLCRLCNDVLLYKQLPALHLYIWLVSKLASARLKSQNHPKPEMALLPMLYIAYYVQTCNKLLYWSVCAFHAVYSMYCRALSFISSNEGLWIFLQKKTINV